MEPAIRGSTVAMLAAGAAIAALAWSGCSAKSNTGPAPPDVKAAVGELESAFAMASADLRSFRRDALASLPRLREALQKWSLVPSSVNARSDIRGWAVEAGAIETSLTDLPADAGADRYGPVIDAWRQLRAKLR